MRGATVQHHSTGLQYVRRVTKQLAEAYDHAKNEEIKSARKKP